MAPHLVIDSPEPAQIPVLQMRRLYTTSIRNSKSSWHSFLWYLFSIWLRHADQRRCRGSLLSRFHTESLELRETSNANSVPEPPQTVFCGTTAISGPMSQRGGHDLYQLDGSRRPAEDKDTVPGCAEHNGHFLPTHPLRPCGREQAIRIRLLILATGPGDSFHDDTALWAIDPSQGIRQRHGDRPQRRKSELPSGQTIIAGPFSVTA